MPFSPSHLREPTPSPNEDRATGLPLVSCWQVSSLPANQEEKAESGLCCSGKAIMLWFEKPLRLVKIFVFLHVPDWGAPRASFRGTVSLWVLPCSFFPDLLRCHTHRHLPSDGGAGHSRGQLSAPRLPDRHDSGARHPADAPLAGPAPSAGLAVSLAPGRSLEDGAFTGPVHQRGTDTRFKE